MKVKNNFLYTLPIIGFILTSCLTNNGCKEFVLANYDFIIKRDAKSFIIDGTNFKYYTDISIRLNDDSSYTIVYWGDRKSWKWNYLKDKYFTVDISYNKSKGIDTKLDEKIIALLKSKK